MPLFSNKIKSDKKITLAGKNEIISSNIEVAKIFQNFFSSIAKNVNIQRDEAHFSRTTQDNPVLTCIEKFSKHPSIVCTKKNLRKQPVTNSLLNMKKEISYKNPKYF